eukprot:3249118-Pleurochrysis_carterae.AAC.1
MAESLMSKKELFCRAVFGEHPNETTEKLIAWLEANLFALELDNEVPILVSSMYTAAHTFTACSA